MSKPIRTTGEIAAALRLLATDLDAMPANLPADVFLTLGLHVSDLDATDTEKTAAVDLLATALTGDPGATAPLPDGGRSHHIPYGHRDHWTGVELSVFTHYPASEVDR